MLLSEVLYLAKNLNPINEAFKSKTIRDILKNLERSSLNLKVEYISTEGVSWYHPSPLDVWDIRQKYRDLNRKGELSQELLDNPKLREILFNIKYVPKKKPTNTYGDYTFIVKLLIEIANKTGNHIGISEIKDSDLVNITPEEAKKKPYKSGLQFWFDYNDDLKAICKDNKIICLLVRKGEWLESNPDYTGPTDINLFKNLDNYSYNQQKEITTEFIDKAFRNIPVYELKYSNYDIKQELGANNIKTLQEKGHVYKVLAVNEEGQKNSDYNQIIEKRLDYKKYLNSQMNLAQKNYERRQNEIKVRKEQGIDNNILQTIDEAYDTIFDIYSEMQTFMMTYISNIEKYKISYTRYVDITNYYEWKGLKNIVPNNVVEFNGGTQRNKRIRTSFYITNIGDAFITINYYLELLLNNLQDLTNKVNQLTKMKENNEDKTYLLNQLKNIKSQYANFFKMIEYDNNVVLDEALATLLSVKINPTSILTKLTYIKPKIKI